MIPDGIREMELLGRKPERETCGSRMRADSAVLGSDLPLDAEKFRRGAEPPHRRNDRSS